MQTKHALVAAILIHTGLLLGAYGGLVVFFDFPEILREPVDVYLAQFRAHASIVVVCYAAFTWSQVAFAGLAVILRERFLDTSTAWLRAGTSLGVIAGFAQAVGFSRWAFVVPSLATSMETTPETTRALVDMLHQFAGVAMGEHIFFCFEALWVAAVALHFLERPGTSHVSRRGALLLLLIACSIAVYALEQFGGLFSLLGPLNVTAHGALVFWLVGLAIRQAFNRTLHAYEVAILTLVWAALVVPSFF